MSFAHMTLLGFEGFSREESTHYLKASLLEFGLVLVASLTYSLADPSLFFLP